MDQGARFQLARQLMEEFAAATGLTGTAPLRRYLWTDAFAVCNFLGLHRASGEGRDLDLALRLIDQVHHVLGRHRQDDKRQGWISGLPEEEGERHPTCGGLRIGKELPERGAEEPFEPHLEWDRDGQYFHYLTQWMHALHRVGQEMGQSTFHRWAVELAQIAHARFTRLDQAGRPQRMVWKMSIDLSRVLVPSMGQHDPLDGWLAYLELQTGAITALAAKSGVFQASGSDRLVLEREIAEAYSLCANADWATDDALGIGALLTGVFRLGRMTQRHAVHEAGLMTRLVGAARISLEAYARDNTLGAPADARLAFRELGLAIGLHALERIAASPALTGEIRATLESISQHLPLAARIDRFWSDPAHRRSPSWNAHRDINAVMLATSLGPHGYLGT